MNQSQSSLQTFNLDEVKIDTEPLTITPLEDQNSTLRAMKKQKFKDFTLSDSSNKSKKFHKNVLASSDFNKLVEIIEGKSELKLWFDINEKELDAIETYIYKDGDFPSVKFEHTFDLLKLSLALENEKLIGLIITYLTLN